MKRGITLIEALFVLGIMAIIIGMVMILLSQNNDSRKSLELKEEIGLIKSIADQLQISDANPYYGLDAPTLIKSGLIPNKYIDSSGNRLLNPFGGNFDFHIDGNNIWLFWIYGLSKSACIGVSTGQWGNIHNMNINNLGDWGGSWPPDAASQYCNKMDNSNFIGMSFTRY